LDNFYKKRKKSLNFPRIGVELYLMDKAISLLEESVTAFGVRMRCYGGDLAGLEDYDDGLRSRILQRPDTIALEIFLKSMKYGVMYICTESLRLPLLPVLLAPLCAGERRVLLRHRPLAGKQIL
jgi:hypothetical protein